MSEFIFVWENVLTLLSLGSTEEIQSLENTLTNLKK